MICSILLGFFSLRALFFINLHFFVKRKDGLGRFTGRTGEIHGVITPSVVSIEHVG